MKNALMVLGLLISIQPAFSDSAIQVAGLTPDHRPVNAPQLKDFVQTQDWLSKALRGIEEPRTGIGFLKDQGAWYTPFNRPNLPGRYDIRQMYPSDKKE